MDKQIILDSDEKSYRFIFEKIISKNKFDLGFYFSFIFK